MSDINSIPSPILCKLSNTTCKTFTPCRTIGLKRKSSSTPSYKNELKKTKLLNETRKCIQFDEDVKSIKTKTKDKSNSITSYKRDMKHISVLEKQRKIENLKSEIKNSEQHNLDEIHKLSKKWLMVCQEAIMSLFNQLNGNPNHITIKDLITSLNIDPDLIHFDSDNQEFYQ